MKASRSAAVFGFAFIALIVLITGCGGINGNRTAEEWLSLSYSGLAGTDQYMYTGSLSIFADNGVAFAPLTFEGKVVDHKQLSIQTSSEEPLLLNPVKTLERLSKQEGNASVEIKESGNGIIKLLIKEESEVSRGIWSDMLRGQLEQLASKGPLEAGSFKLEWERELAVSNRQLNEMLASLEADTAYELVIDSKSLLPLKLDEQTTFHYMYNGAAKTENRHTSVRFQSFDGATSKAVQYR